MTIIIVKNNYKKNTYAYKHAAFPPRVDYNIFALIQATHHLVFYSSSPKKKKIVSTEGT